MEFLFYFLGGSIIGFIISSAVYRTKSAGTLRIIKDEDGEYVFAILKNGLHDIRGKKMAKFLIDDRTQK